MTYAILYISSLSKGVNDTQIQEIFSTTLSTNLKNDISGFLLYDKGNFVQLLEGDKHAISNIFSKIEKDLRHQNITVILDQPTEIKAFDFYHSGFKICDNHKLIKELNEYIKVISSIEEPKLKKTIHLIEGILKVI